MRRTITVAVGVVFFALSAFAGDGRIRRSNRAVPGQYVVSLEPGLSPQLPAVAQQLSWLHRGKLANVYRTGGESFSVRMNEADAQALGRDPRVAMIEEDSWFSASEVPWGLDRINQRYLPLDSRYQSDATGTGVKIFVLDTGISSAHQELAGRVSRGFSAVSDGRGTEDCSGHGTHVAGIAAGASYGVARSATVVPVRVLDCSGNGTLSNVLAGLDWVLGQHRSGTPAVVNMSLSGDASTTLDRAVNRLIDAGVSCIVAAGNSGKDACTESPARIPRAITVGAIGLLDRRAWFSNFGSCVDLFAPGVDIPSAWHIAANSSNLLSGTSAAAPHVAGVAALLLEQNRGLSPSTVSNSIRTSATANVIDDPGSASPNLLLFSAVQKSTGGKESQLVIDPSFETGEGFTESRICMIVKPISCTQSLTASQFSANTGSGLMALGGTGTAQSEFFMQQVTIPADAQTAMLSFYLRIVTEELSSAPGDVLTVDVRDEADRPLEILTVLSNRNHSANYGQRRFDLKRYRGHTIRIRFTSQENSSKPTWFLLDDITVNVTH